MYGLNIQNLSSSLQENEIHKLLCGKTCRTNSDCSISVRSVHCADRRGCPTVDSFMRIRFSVGSRMHCRIVQWADIVLESGDWAYRSVWSNNSVYVLYTLIGKKVLHDSSSHEHVRGILQRCYTWLYRFYMHLLFYCSTGKILIVFCFLIIVYIFRTLKLTDLIRQPWN